MTGWRIDTEVLPLLWRQVDFAAGEVRIDELSFMANAMLAGCSVYDRPLTVQGAWDAAVGVCNMGLNAWADGGERAALPEPFLAEHDL